MRSVRIRYWVLLVAAVLFILLVDQTTKWLVRQNLAVNEAWAPIPALARIFTITHVRNTGVAFGQLPGLGGLFMLINISVLIGILIYYPRVLPGQRLFRLALILITAGDLGKLLDRGRTMILAARDGANLLSALQRAYVTDMFDFKIWPVFNISDLCVSSGVVLLALILWQQERATAAAARQAPAGDETPPASPPGQEARLRDPAGGD